MTGLVFGLSVTANAAQAAPTGTIHGRVMNATNGKYLSNATVDVEGTSLQAMTDEYGDYELDNVPVGSQKVTAFFTGQEPLTATVNVAAGQNIKQDFNFNAGAEATSNKKGPVTLDEFVVQSQRFKNAQDLAINEERNSVNIKDVVSTDEFGDVPEGNIGEFVKYMPGVIVNYGGRAYSNGQDATDIMVRGFGADQTAITIDGMPVASADPGSLTRAVSLDMLSINNASRIELTKVPTPDMPSDSIGGSVNLVTKSAFEYAKPTFNWRVYGMLNSESLSMHKTPGPYGEKSYKIRPGADFTLAYPISRNFGFSFSGAHSDRFTQYNRAKIKYGYSRRRTRASDGAKSDAANPYYKSLEITDGPTISKRNSGDIKLDWRPFYGSLLTANFQLSNINQNEADRRFSLTPDNTVDWGPTYTIGKFGSSQKGDQSVIELDRQGTTHSGYLKWTYHNHGWNIFLAGSNSVSDGHLRSVNNGHFSEVDLNLSNVGQVMFKDIKDGLPGQVTVLDKQGNVMDPSRLSNYKLNYSDAGLIARAGNSDTKNTRNTLKLDVSRDLDFLSGPFANMKLKAGLYRESNRETKSGRGTNYEYLYTGPASELDITQYQDSVYDNVSPGFGFQPWQWVDPGKVYQFYLKNKQYFTDSSDDTTNGQSIAAHNWIEYVNTNKDLTQTQTAFYGELNGSFFNNRLKFVTGFRREDNKKDGYQPYQNKNWNLLMNPDGTVYKDTQDPGGVDITKQSNFDDAALRARIATAGVTWDHVLDKNSLEAAKLQWIAKSPIHEVSHGHPSFTFSTSYNITKNLVGRFGYARTYAQQDFEGGYGALGRTTVQINSKALPGDIPQGTINVANPNLRPWSANNYDFQLAYYTKSGGKFSVDYYTKNIKDFWISNTVTLDQNNYAEVLNSIGFTPSDYFIDWNVNTKENGVGTASTHGWEFSVRQNLGIVGRWGKYFNVFANYTKKHLSQNQTTNIAITPNKAYAWGINFSSHRLSARLNAVYRAAQNNGSFGAKDQATGRTIKVYQYTPSMVEYDAGINYQLSEKYSLFVDGRNIFNTKTKQLQFDPTGVFPTYASVYDIRNYGVLITAGIRGRF